MRHSAAAWSEPTSPGERATPQSRRQTLAGLSRQGLWHRSYAMDDDRRWLGWKVAPEDHDVVVTTSDWDAPEIDGLMASAAVARRPRFRF